VDFSHFFIGEKLPESKGKKWLAKSIKGGGNFDFKKSPCIDHQTKLNHRIVSKP
jgi:hypothetical protein